MRAIPGSPAIDTSAAPPATTTAARTAVCGISADLARACATPSPCAAAQGDGVAQALAKSAEIPHTAVLAAVVVAGGAAEVSIAGEPGIARIVENLLALQDLRGQLFRADGRPGAERLRIPLAVVHELRDVENADASIHEVIDVKL